MNRNHEKILGVIGGMGPLASQLFYSMVIDKTKADRDQDHLDMIILNHASMPDRTEAIVRNDKSQITELLEKDAEYLRAGGADVIVITCNTAHRFIDGLKEKTDMEVIDMIDTTASCLADRGVKRAGILATDGTVNEGLYQGACLKYGIEPVLPSEKAQKKIMSIIYDGVKKGGPLRKEDMDPIIEEMREKGCEKIILGCTEFSCFRKMFGLPDICVDALEVTAVAAIEKCGKELKG